MLYNIWYWWLFLPHGNRWTKYLVHLKIRRLKLCQLMFASLVALDGFHLLLSTQMIAELTLEWSGGSMFHPLSHIYAKTPFYCVWNSYKQCSESSTRCCFGSTVSKRSTHFEHSFLIDKCSCKMMNTLPSDNFNSSAISRNFNLQSAKTSFMEFFGDFRDNCRICWAFSIICVYTTALKVSILPLNRCFRRSRVRITLIKSLLCLKSFFFKIFLKIATVASLK